MTYNNDMVHCTPYYTCYVTKNYNMLLFVTLILPYRYNELVLNPFKLPSVD